MVIVDFSTIINIIVFKKYLETTNVTNNLTKRDCDEDKASTPHFDEYKLCKLLIIHILVIFYNLC